MRRLTFSLAAVLVAASVAIAAGVASAGTHLHHVKPVLTATQASFTIPSSPAGVWRLKITNYPPPYQILGETTGTSGTLTLPVPQTSNCQLQADVGFQAAGTAKFVFYSGTRHVLPGCGQSGTGQRLTPGYWKNHEAATTALLPQSLGNDSVSTFDQARAILVAMKCSNAVNCLAGHLLAAELDVAHGSSICITGVIFQANQFLISVNYTGPGSYPITASQRAQALAFEQALDNYTNDSTSTSC